MNHTHATIQRALTHMMACALNREPIEPQKYEGIATVLGDCNPPHMAQLMLNHLAASREATRRIKIIEPLVYIATLLNMGEADQ